MKYRQPTDRAAVKVEIDRLLQIETEADTSIGQGISRRIRQLEIKLEANPKLSNERAA